MSYKVELSDNFKKEAKKLIKKFDSLKDDLALLFKQLEQNPEMGTSLGNNFYKIRLAIKSKNKGKSGGARIISYLKVTQEKVILLSIFNKGEKESISDKEILFIMESEGLI